MKNFSRVSKLVSIVIPSFNREDIISETLLSIQNQTFNNWEAIIVDDGSTDNTLERVSEFTKQDERFKVFQRDRLPKGAPVCRNIGLSYAKGDYVVFLDSDDILASWCLANRVEQFEKNRQLDFIVFYGAFFTNSISDATVLWNRFDERNDLERFLKGESVWQTSAPIWRTSYLKEKNIIFNESAKSSQDWEFPVKALLQNPAYKTIESIPNYFIRRTPGVERISEGHWSKEKILNRANLYRSVINDYLDSKAPFRYKLYVFKIIISQHHFLLKNLRQSFDFEHIKLIKADISSLPLSYKLALLYLNIGNRLVEKHASLYRIFRKICEKLFLEKFLFNKSTYRSKMSEEEIQKLHLIMHHDNES